MDLSLPFLKRQKSVDELEEETENLEAENRHADQELSLAQKRYTIQELKARGLKVSQFSGDSMGEKLKRAFNWLAPPRKQA